MTETPINPTIMLVDDTPENLQLLREMFDRAEYRVVAFPSGKLALAAAAKNPPDIILLDITMPEMDGFEVCERLKADEILREIPIIFVSALTETHDKVRAFTAGGVDYVTKPFQFEEVRARVRTHLELCRTRRELKRQNNILHENLRLHELVEQISRHDLKSPLTVFLNVPGMLMESENLQPDQKELIQYLITSGQRMSEMIRRSLDLIKMEQGIYKLMPVSVDIMKVVRQVFDELNGMMALKNLQRELSLDGLPVPDSAVLPVQGEELLFHSILANLIKNAIEASPEGVKITVALISQPEFSVSIHNLGAIPAHIRSRFFDRYVTSGKEQGTGLGVFSAHLMTRTLGGDLSFTTDDTEGTTLTLSIPGNPAPKNESFREDNP
ncbi:MAG: hybrid sensor histidine kinase/response regulator [Candidatus Riflebacteria bacterium HGW-Riflebacteria-1]|jgi:DNA-binding response OmpR family regulator|nr:MAG: hybrid sensor histidine kinase/response regulator [Candidatus Riflebacteria bacterium HGW-Riflebacteria-1]